MTVDALQLVQSLPIQAIGVIALLSLVWLIRIDRALALLSQRVDQIAKDLASHRARQERGRATDYEE